MGASARRGTEERIPLRHRDSTIRRNARRRTKVRVGSRQARKILKGKDCRFALLIPYSQVGGGLGWRTTVWRNCLTRRTFSGTSENSVPHSPREEARRPLPSWGEAKKDSRTGRGGHCVAALHPV